jgi:hypothetical protein
LPLLWKIKKSFGWGLRAREGEGKVTDTAKVVLVTDTEFFSTGRRESDETSRICVRVVEVEVEAEGTIQR